MIINPANKVQDSDKTEDRPDRLNKNIMRPRSSFREKRDSEFEERVIEVGRVARTVAGGRRIRFRALVVIGNRKGKVGMGLAKANDVSEAVRKAVAQAKKHIIEIPIIGGTIPYEVTHKFGSAVVMLKPAASGTSIVAGGSVRAVAELAGITDLLGKMLGSASKVNNIVATIEALSSFSKKYTDIIKGYAEKAEQKLAPAEKEAVVEKIVEPIVEPVAEKTEPAASAEPIEPVKEIESAKPVKPAKKAPAKAVKTTAKKSVTKTITKNVTKT